MVYKGTIYLSAGQLLEADLIALKVHRKSNAKRKDSVSAAFIKNICVKE